MWTRQRTARELSPAGARSLAARADGADHALATSRARAGRGSLAALAVSLLCLAPLGAQTEGESTLQQVRRDQGRIGLRLASLREKMERLAERYEAEGRERNAVLLRSAMTRFDELSLEQRSRDAEQGLAGSMLSSVERQDDLLGGLESIYAVLRDRRDVDELRSQADLLSEGVQELDRLAIEQRQLEARSRAASDTPAKLVGEALDEVQRLDRALEQGAEAAQLLSESEHVLGEAALAEWLARQQRELAQAPQPSAASQVEIMRALESLLAQLSEPLDSTGAEELMAAAQGERQRAAEVGARARAAMEQARRALLGAPGPADGAGESPTGDGQPSDGQSSDGQPSDGQASDGQSSDGKASDGKASDGQSSDGQPGDGEPRDGQAADGQPSADQPGQDPTGDGQPSADQPGDGQPGAGSGAAKPPSASAGAEGQPAESGEPSGASPSGTPSSSPPGGASSSPGQPPASGQPSPAGAQPADSAPGSDPEAASPSPRAQDELNQAAELMEQMRDALADAERAANAARNRALAKAGAAARQAEDPAQDLNETAQRLETLEPDEGPELLDRTRELMAQMQAVDAARDQGDRDATAEALAQSANDLAAIRAMLEQRAAAAPETEQQPRDPSERADAAAQQEQLQERLRELMDRLSELPDQGFQEPAKRAEQAMAGAQQDLSSGDDQQAAAEQQEAAEELEEARSKLQGERDRYEQLRQDEVLFKLKQELVAMHEAQLGLSGETSALDEARGDAERLSRSQRRAVGRLSEEERLLGARAQAAAETLRQDGAVAFVFAIAQVGDDLMSVAERLAEQETGYLVSALQQGVERRLADLLAVLDDELKRRREAEKEPPQEGQQSGGPPPLVPAVAELLLVQRMELMALSRVVEFADDLGDDPMLSRRDVLLLERWANEHAAVTELFESMVPEPPEVEAPGMDQPFPPLPPPRPIRPGADNEPEEGPR
ncbi:MAG: hypothetical protein DRQ55_09095 [Planctomycetota bacterium]|nr:MAG: hypothetical protein DRQ55_09095 [Planctomycetota bacterium]